MSSKSSSSGGTTFPSQALAKKVRRKYPQFCSTYEKWQSETLQHSQLEFDSVLKRTTSTITIANAEEVSTRATARDPSNDHHTHTAANDSAAANAKAKAETGPDESNTVGVGLVGALVFLGEGVQSGITDFRPLRHIANEIASTLELTNDQSRDGAFSSADTDTASASTFGVAAGKLCFHSEHPFTIVELVRKQSSSEGRKGTASDEYRNDLLLRSSQEDSSFPSADSIILEKCDIADCFALQNAVGGPATRGSSAASSPTNNPSPLPSGTTAAIASGQKEWVVSLKRKGGSSSSSLGLQPCDGISSGCEKGLGGGGVANTSNSSIGEDFYVVRLLLVADEGKDKSRQTIGEPLTPSSSHPIVGVNACAMPLTSIAKLIAGCDGVPVVCARSQSEAADTIREAIRYSSYQMPHLQEVYERMMRKKREGGDDNNNDKAKTSVGAPEKLAEVSRENFTTKSEKLLPLPLEAIPVDEVPGLYVVPNFLTFEEEARIVEELMAYDDTAATGPSQDKKGQVASELPSEEERGGDGSSTTPWEQLARRDVLHFSRRFFYDTMKVGAVGENVSGPNPTFYRGLVERLCTGIQKPLWGNDTCTCNDGDKDVDTPYSSSHATSNNNNNITRCSKVEATLHAPTPSSSRAAEKRPRDEPLGPSATPLYVEAGENPTTTKAAKNKGCQEGWPVPVDHLCDQFTVNRYRYDQKQKVSSGIAQHVDVHSFFGDIVFSVSLLSHTLLEYERPTPTDKSIITKRVPIFAAPRSLLIMTGEARFLWTHAIQHKYADFVAECFPSIPRRDRISLTLRKARSEPSVEHNLSNCPYPIMCDSKV